MVSDTFKSNILKFGKLISVRITFNDGNIFEKDDITYCSKGFEGEPFKTVMQYVDIELKNSINVKDKTFELEFGVKADEASEYEYISWGNYAVDNESIEKKIDTQTTKFTAYDYLKYAGVNYVEMDVIYPLTLRDFLSAVCFKLGYVLKTESFANSDTILYDDRFIGTVKYTYRNVLDQIAGAAGAVIYLVGTDLYVKYPTDINYIIDENNLKTLSISSKFGPLNSIAFTNKIKDTINREQDEASIEKNGLCEVELVNNVLINTSYKDYSTKIFNKIGGFETYQFELETFGYCFFAPSDIVTIKDLDGNVHKSLILSDTVTVTTGLTETLGCQIDNPKSIDYTKKDDVQTLIKNTTENLQDAVYYGTNNNTIKIGTEEVELIRIRFTSKVEATPLFNASLIMKIDTPGLLEFTYMLDNVAYHVHPKHSVLEGYCTLHLFLPLYQLEGSKAHELAVMLTSLDATGSIGRNQIQSTINGQGLEVVNSEWDGTIVCNEDFRDYEFVVKGNVTTLDSFRETIDSCVDDPISSGLTEKVGAIEIFGGKVEITNTTDQLMMNEIIVNFELTEGEYNHYYVANNGYKFDLITSYNYKSVENIIDEGNMQILDLNDLTEFERVESIEVVINE